MADTQAQLDSAIAGVATQVSTLSTELTQAVADLEAKIASSGTPTDFTPEVTQLSNIASALTAAGAAITAADPGPATTDSGSTSTAS